MVMEIMTTMVKCLRVTNDGGGYDTNGGHGERKVNCNDEADCEGQGSSQGIKVDS